MPRYVIHSETPITAREISRPDGGGGSPETGLPGVPEHPWLPGQGRPLPPKEEWPPLPPWLEEGGPSLPIAPSPEFPMVPIPPGEIDPPGIWPPVRPEFPDLEGKTLALAYVYVSRHVSKLCWIVIDHEDAKDAWEKLKEHVKDRLPAGGIGGRPPERPTPQR